MAASNKNTELNGDLRVFVTCPSGMEGLLADELKSLSVHVQRETAGGLYCSGDWPAVYRACLWSRIANRVLLQLSDVVISTSDSLYQAAKAITWSSLFSPSSTFLVNFLGTNKEIRNSQFGALTVKDAIVDHFREQSGIRPSVDRDAPNVRVNVHLSKGRVSFAIDLSGESLHKRGYRVAQGEAPLKENLAAALLLRAGWKQILEEHDASEWPELALLDPMCGSGTILIEGALMAANIAPGLTRKRFGFENLLSYDDAIWQNIVSEAQQQKEEALAKPLPEIRGYDIDPRVLDAATANIEAAGLQDLVRLTKKNAAEFKKPTHKTLKGGLLLCNPPYGERLGQIDKLRQDYRNLGQVVKAELTGWSVGVFTGNNELAREMRLRPKKRYKLFNGKIPSELLLYDIVGEDLKLREQESDIVENKDVESKDVDNSGSDNDTHEALSNETIDAKSEVESPVSDTPFKHLELSEGATMVANRLTKNIKQLKKWAKQNKIECYRVYDADMPEYSAAIDYYGDYVHVQEYQAPRSIDEEKAEKRFNELVVATSHVFDLDDEFIVLKQRRRNRGKMQYEKLDRTGADKVFTVGEGKARLEINLWDYLDTGLFLDHRPLRLKIAQEAMGKSFLNLFCYTATASVHAALAGATSSVSVDMSPTYIEWSKRNYSINNLNQARHQLVKADCTEWLKTCRQGFDMIMLDPPSFSNSKKMQGVFDVQRDHVALIKRCMELLTPNGVLYFSNNLRSFKLDGEGLGRFRIVDITPQTIDTDFKKNPKIHYCWEIRHA